MATDFSQAEVVEYICSEVIRLAVPAALDHEKCSARLSAFTGSAIAHEFALENAFQKSLWEDEAATPRKPLRCVEAFLWTPTCRQLLAHLGFREGNYVVANRRKEDLVLPHYDAPSIAVRLPLCEVSGDNVLSIADSVAKRFGNQLDFAIENWFANPPIEFDRAVFPTADAHVRSEALRICQNLLTHRRSRQSGGELLPPDQLAILWKLFPTPPSIQESEWRQFVIERVDDQFSYEVAIERIASWRRADLPFHARTEFLRFLSGEAAVTAFESDTGTLFVDDGEIGCLLFEAHLIPNNRVFIDSGARPLSTNALIEMGLITQEADHYRIGPRAKGMARWIQKVTGIALHPTVDDNIRPLRSGHAWQYLVSIWQTCKDSVAECTDRIIQQQHRLTGAQTTALFRVLANTAFSPDRRRDESQIIASVPIHLAIHGHLRHCNTEPRDLLAFLMSGQASSSETNELTVGFLGSVNITPALDGDDDDSVARNFEGAHKAVNRLKTIVGLVGYLNAEGMLEVEVREDAVREFLGRTAHGVRTRAQGIQFDGARAAHDLERILDGDAALPPASKALRDVVSDVLNLVRRMDGNAYDLAQYVDVLHRSIDRRPIDEMPELIHDLDTMFADQVGQAANQLGFSPAFETTRDKYIQRFGDIDFGAGSMPVHRVVGTAACNLVTVKTVLATIFLEAVKNSVRQLAKTVTLRLDEVGDGWVRLAIEDDGLGFSAPKRGGSGFVESPTGGLAVIKGHVELLGGRRLRRKDRDGQDAGAVVEFEIKRTWEPI